MPNASSAPSRRTCSGSGPLKKNSDRRCWLFRETYNTNWLIGRHGFITPTTFRQGSFNPPRRRRAQSGVPETADCLPLLMSDNPYDTHTLPR